MERCADECSMTSCMEVVVTEVGNDSMMVRCADGSTRHLSFLQGDMATGGYLSLLRPSTKLHLLGVADDGERLLPQYIIVEPDYLLDVSALAECCRPYGFLWQLYFYNRLRPRELTRHILLGNAANLILDELVNAANPADVTLADILKKFFASAPLELSVCDGIDKAFFNDMAQHLAHLQRVVADDFSKARLRVGRGVIEPSFISPTLGLRGRLDYLQVTDDSATGIELKSGKNSGGYIADTHRVQLSLYQMMLHYALQVENPHFYALYSRYSQGNLIRSHLSPSLMQRVFGVRNRIVLEEQRMAEGDPKAFVRLIDAWAAPRYEQPSHPLVRYIDSDIKQMAKRFTGSVGKIELPYFSRMYRFVSQELYLSKVGHATSEREGITLLWQNTAAERQALGCMMAPLILQENHTGDEQPLLSFTYRPPEGAATPNFREGDIVLLYRYNGDESLVTKQPLFRAILMSLNSHEVVLCLRDRQQNNSLFMCGGAYAIEPDYSDASFTQQFRNLYAFMQAPEDRRRLLLGNEGYIPRMGTPARLTRAYDSPEVADIIARSTGDGELYLLLGPPGTGKTSIALMGMVHEIMAAEGRNLLLVAYTNRAVDEICSKLEQTDYDYIRVGMEFSCGKPYRHRLLSHRIEGCTRRDEVVRTLTDCRLYVASLVTLLSKPELFTLKHFDTAIIDEASQLLEPQLLGLFAATDARGALAIDRFVLIGDYRQLPAIVVQSEKESRIEAPLLQACGITDCRMSLFERLYRRYSAFPQMTGMLSCQWRMHPDIADFASTAFYQNKLCHGSAPHQCNDLPFVQYDRNATYQTLLATNRLAFVDVNPCGTDRARTNHAEAQVAAQIVAAYYRLHEQNHLPFHPAEAIGIITPYRNQIAAIRCELEKLQLSDINSIRVDTVERFQGSQNELIIFSCAVTNRAELAFLSTYSIEDGMPIDRKLNVAITRARRQLVVVGCRELLSTNPIYAALLRYIGERGSIV